METRGFSFYIYTPLNGVLDTRERNEMKSNHTSYYVNVGQTIGIIGGLILGFKALRVEETKAGIEHRSVKEVICEDINRVKGWWSDNFGSTRQYKHY